MLSKFNLKSIFTTIAESTVRGHLIRFSLFIFLYYLFRTLLTIFSTTEFGSAILDPLFNFLSFIITKSCVFLLAPFYSNITVIENFTVYINNLPYLYMAPGCTGLIPMISLSLSLILYPISLPKKTWLWPVSIGILLFASILHFLILIPIAYKYPQWFNLFHTWITRIIFYGFYFLAWLLWEKAKTKTLG